MTVARTHSYNSGRIRRADTLTPTQMVELRNAPGRPGAVAKKKGKSGRKALLVVMSVFLVFSSVLVVSAGILLNYINNDLLVTGDMGEAAEQYTLPPELDGKVINILILGMDYSEDRTYTPGGGLSDLVMLLHFDIASNQMKFLQVPRDLYIGSLSGGGGRINSALALGKDRENPINNVFAVFKEQFKIQVDKYVTIDMDALRDIVDALGGIKVYVPNDMNAKGSRLEKGWRVLDGEATEFFVRCRTGPGFERSDADRLDNQRYFYSAMFRRLMNMTPTDILKMMPLFDKYCNTNLSVKELAQVAIAFQKVPKEQIMFCKVPGATGGPTLEEWPGIVTGDPGHFVVEVKGREGTGDLGLAEILNEYFRSHDPSGSVAAADLGFPNVTIPPEYALYPPGIQFLGDVQGSEEGGDSVDPEPV